MAMAGHELCGLIATYFGSQSAQALIPHIKSRRAGWGEEGLATFSSLSIAWNSSENCFFFGFWPVFLQDGG